MDFSPKSFKSEQFFLFLHRKNVFIKINTIRNYMFIHVNIFIPKVFINDNNSKTNWYGKSV